MERTLNRFIPLIRFYYITPENFLDKVYPFKELLPNDLFKSILAFHMTPNRKLNNDILPRFPKYSVDSIIIETQHFALFSNWIDRKDNFQINSRNIPYNFTLLYRANSNEMNATNFHNKCDNKGATIFVAKIKGTNQIVGGYNPLDWITVNGGFKITSDSYIFFFNDYRDVKTGKLGRVTNTQRAIYCRSDLGPFFGYQADLYFNGNWGSVSIPDAYPNLNIPNSFNIDNCEVFQVVKRG